MFNGLKLNKVVGWAGEEIHPALFYTFYTFLPHKSGSQQHNYLENF